MGGGPSSERPANAVAREPGRGARVFTSDPDHSAPVIGIVAEPRDRSTSAVRSARGRAMISMRQWGPQLARLGAVVVRALRWVATRPGAIYSRHIDRADLLGI